MMIYAKNETGETIEADRENVLKGFCPTWRMNSDGT